MADERRNPNVPDGLTLEERVARIEDTLWPPPLPPLSEDEQHEARVKRTAAALDRMDGKNSYGLCGS